MSKHFRSDGNGGFIISKKFLATMLTVITIISLLAGFFSSALAFQGDYTHIKDSVAQLEKENESVHPVVIQNKEDIAVMKVTLDRVDRNVQKLIDSR